MTNINKKFFRRRISLLLLAVVTVGLIIFLNRGVVRTLGDQIAGRDYAGAGTTKVLFSVAPGETGSDIARELVKLGIVKNFDIVYRLMLSSNTKFYPGTYALKHQMSAESALTALANPSNLQVTKVTIQEGLRLAQVLQKLADSSGIPLSNFQSAAGNLSSFNLPAKSPSLEGFLFPATYEFPAKSSAFQILKTMVDRCFQELDNFEVNKDDALKILTLASIVQKEARQTSDFYKVSRVFTNRLSIQMPLQSDATVSYGSGGTTVTTTDAERAAANGYNTYKNAGLPIGPISAPGSLAIDAALHPVAGKWLFFCAINLKTGETVFSETAAQHELAVVKFRAWIAQNPGWNG